MWTKLGCIAFLLTCACCAAQQASVDQHDAPGSLAADTASGGCSFETSLANSWQSGSTYYTTLTLTLHGAGSSFTAPYQVTAAGPQYSIVTETWNWSVTNADTNGVRGNVTNSAENLDSAGGNTVTLSAIVGGASPTLTPQTVSINGQHCGNSNGTSGAGSASTTGGGSTGGTTGAVAGGTSVGTTTGVAAGGTTNGTTSGGATATATGDAGYTQENLQSDITALANGGGLAGFGNPANVSKWNATNIADLYAAIVATHDQLFPFMALADFAHAGLSEAAAESTMDPGHFDGTSMGLLQCTTGTNGADFNTHATAITSSTGATVLDPSETITDATLQDPGVNWVVWAWTIYNEGSTGETPHEVSLGQQHAPAGWTGTLHDAMRCWLSGAGLGYSPSDYAARGGTYFNNIQTYMGLIAPGDFDRLMATQIPQMQPSHFKDVGAGL